MKEIRKEFTILPVTINDRRITRVVIDPHYEKHKDISVEIIMRLVRFLDGKRQNPDDIDPPYSYFVASIWLEKKCYRLVWLFEGEETFIGIVAVHRERRKS